MKKAIGYVRVSTIDQAEEGISLDAQKARIADYCRLHDLELAGIESDNGISGKRSDNRPGLQKAMIEVCRVRGVLVVYSLSRFARSTRDCMDLSEKIRQCGAALASITERIDTGSAMGEFFFVLLAALGQLERRQIGDRTKAALSHLRRQNRRISRILPYGWKLVKDGEPMEPEPFEQGVLNIVQDMRRDGYGYKKIVRILNEQGVPPRSGSRWHLSVVRTIIARMEKQCESTTN